MNDVEKIKNSINIEDVVGEYVELKPAGSSLKGLCPFHQEKTPSFMVHPAKQIYKCFGCGEGGDVISFIEKIENVEFVEALKILAQKCGIELTTYKGANSNIKTKLQDIISFAVSFYEKNLWSDKGKKALEYLKSRGLKEDTIRKMNIGYAPEGWDNLSKLLSSKRIDVEMMSQSGLIVLKQDRGFYDRFRDRIMFPIFNEHGIAVGFTSRLLPEKEKNEKYGGKYVNTPETLIYHKSNILYGFHLAKDEIKKQKTVIVVEGNMDFILSYQAGVKNVVASSGTAFTSQQLNILKRYATDMVFCFDMDDAGRNAFKKSLVDAWAFGFNVSALYIPSGKDPADLVLMDRETWIKVSSKKIPAIDYLIFLAEKRDKLSFRTDEGKKFVFREILPFVKILPNPLDKQKYINILSDKMDVDPEFVKESLQKISANRAVVSKNRRESVKNTSKNINIEDIIISLSAKYPKIAIEVDSGFSLSEYFSDSKHIDMFAKIKANKINLSDYPEYEMIYEKEYSDFTDKEAKDELINLSKNMIKKKLSEELKILTKQMQIEEKHQNKSKIDELLNKMNQITSKLNKLDKISL